MSDTGNRARGDARRVSGVLIVLGLFVALTLGTCRVLFSFGDLDVTDCGSHCTEESEKEDASRQWMGYGAWGGIVAAGIGVVALIVTRRRR